MGYLHCLEQGLTFISTNGVVRMKLALMHLSNTTRGFYVKPELVSTPPEGVYQRLIKTFCLSAFKVVVSLTTMF